MYNIALWWNNDIEENSRYCSTARCPPCIPVQICAAQIHEVKLNLNLYLRWLSTVSTKYTANHNYFNIDNFLFVKQWPYSYMYINCETVVYLTNRFHFCVRLYCNRSHVKACEEQKSMHET